MPAVLRWRSTKAIRATGVYPVCDAMARNLVTPAADRLSFQILGQRISIECADETALGVLAQNFQAMGAADDKAASISYTVTTGNSGSFALSRPGQRFAECKSLGNLLFCLEQDLTVELQRRRPDLLFLHSAVLDWQGAACLLVAESGSGKSLTTWALLHHGFGYLSDELGPIDVEALQVSPYPHALNLKELPAAPYAAPAATIDLGRTFHIPVSQLPGATVSESRPLAAVFLLQHQPELGAPELTRLRPSEAGARLHANALNLLAHPNGGLDAVVRIAEHARCFSVTSTDLPRTCALICSTARRAVVGPS